MGGFSAGVFLVEVIPKVADLGNIMLGDIRVKANRFWCRVRFVRFQFSLFRLQGLKFVEKGGPGPSRRDRVDNVVDPVWSRNSAALSGRAWYGPKAPQRGKWCRGLRIYSDPSRVGPIRDQ